MWISIDKTLQSVKLRVLRQFYLNFKSMPKEGTFGEGYRVESLVRTLPRGHPCMHLFKVTVPEDVFQEEDVHFSGLINNPNVDGVFELQVPLDVRALIKLGSSCTLESTGQGKLSKALDSGFDLEDLIKAAPMVTSKHRYLNGGAEMRHFYLYHASKGGRHVMGLFTPEGEAKVHIVDPAGVRQLPNLETMYADRAANMKKRGKLVGGKGVFDYPDNLSIELKVHTSEARAFKALARELKTLRTAKQGSAMLAICSSKGQQYYEQRMSAVTEFPILPIPAARPDDDLPPLGWQLYSTRRMLNCYFRTSLWIRRWIDLASHFDLPLCNVEKDFAVFGADIDFARRLTKQDMVLWWSAAPTPDLGGREEDVHAQQSWDEAEGLEISHPGCYSNVCLEVDLRDLAIDAVLQSGSVNEMEGSGAGSMAFDTASHNLDEYSKGTAHSSMALGDSVLTSQVFNAVKGMVKAWFMDKARGRSQYSNVLADNFWRWASSSASAMFEPAMQRFLHGLMRKTLLQLLAEFKRLGAQLVFASFNRIFLLTSKPTAGSAAAYGRYLMSAVTSRDLFKHLSLEIVHFWEYLLWMDIANFGGVISLDAEEAEPSPNFNVEMNWNVQTFLPPALQDRFSSIIGSFIYQLYDSKRKSVGLDRTPMRVIQGTAGTQPDPTKTKEAKFAKDLVNHQMTRKLLRMLDDAQTQMGQAATDPDLASQWAFPDLPGSHLKLTNPSLEFVKTVTAVLALSKELMVEVQVCKRNLLELIGVREFAAEAEWRNPCEPFRLPLVICQFCNDDRALDLCRDADLMPAAPGQFREWRCAKCDFPYDRTAIEARLVGIVQRHVTTFALQDLRCNKCGRVRADNLGAQCSCSGSWGLTVTRKETLRRLRGLGTIAKFHSLDMLASVVDWHLASI